LPGLGELARLARAEIGTKTGRRILHVTDLHNRLAGLRLTHELIGPLGVDVVVNTGDVSGMGPAAEAVFAALMSGGPVPLVYAAGNHDSDYLGRRLTGAGAVVLDGPRPYYVCDMRFWGYPDPNQTRLFGPKGYDKDLVREIAGRNWPPGQEDGLPLIACVHHELMAEPAAEGVPLVLSGHFHAPKVVRRGPTLYVRTGSTGGGGPFGGPLEASVVDVEPDSCEPLAVWLLKADPGTRVLASPVPL
jgi:predicted MPP superfamily phosphohydrolase